MDDEERAREEREQVVNPNRHSRVQHCCKGRHCCRDNSCRVVAPKEPMPEVRSDLPAPPPGGGWCAPSEAVFGYQEPERFPNVAVKRGGIRWPRFRVETFVDMRRVGFWRRKEWRLHVRYWDPEKHKHAHHYMQFAQENLANNAAETIKFMMQTMNEQYEGERNAS